jgi:hypothetical protein
LILENLSNSTTGCIRFFLSNPGYLHHYQSSG